MCLSVSALFHTTWCLHWWNLPKFSWGWVKDGWLTEYHSWGSYLNSQVILTQSETVKEPVETALNTVGNSEASLSPLPTYCVVSQSVSPGQAGEKGNRITGTHPGVRLSSETEEEALEPPPEPSMSTLFQVPWGTRIATHFLPDSEHTHNSLSPWWRS